MKSGFPNFVVRSEFHAMPCVNRLFGERRERVAGERGEKEGETVGCKGVEGEGGRGRGTRRMQRGVRGSVRECEEELY
jgi:hypothetical protein